MHRLLRWALVPLIGVVILIADQLTKSWVETNIPLGGTHTPIPALEPYFNIVHWTNTGAAFGLLQGHSTIFALVAVVVIVVVLVFSRQLPVEKWGMRFALGLQLGGAAGNLFDRLQQGGQVTDFLLFSLPVGGRTYIWPAWNIADGSIVVGTILLGIMLLWAERKRPQTQPG